MQFTNGVRVYTENKTEVGRITHVVIDPTDKIITHVVVRQGLLFAEDMMIPFDLFITANPEEVILRADASTLEQMLPLSEPLYIAVERSPAKVAEIPMAGGGLYLDSPAEETSQEPGWRGFQYIQSEKQNIPEGTVALKGGARVISADDQRVGNVESILTRTDSDFVSHVVMVSGLLTKTRKIVPTSWFHFIETDTVYLSENAASVETLPEY